MKKVMSLMLGLVMVLMMSGIVFGQTPQVLLDAGMLAATSTPPNITTAIANLEPLDTMLNLPDEITTVYPYYLTFAYMKAGKMPEAFNMAIKAIKVGNTNNMGALFTWTTPSIIHTDFTKLDSMITTSENTYLSIKDIHALRIYTRFEKIKIGQLMKEADNIIPISNVDLEKKKAVLNDVLIRYGKIIQYNREFSDRQDITSDNRKEFLIIVAESQTNQSLILSNLKGL